MQTKTVWEWQKPFWNSPEFCDYSTLAVMIRTSGWRIEEGSLGGSEKTAAEYLLQLDESSLHPAFTQKFDMHSSAYRNQSGEWVATAGAEWICDCRLNMLVALIGGKQGLSVRSFFLSWPFKYISRWVSMHPLFNFRSVMHSSAYRNQSGWQQQWQQGAEWISDRGLNTLEALMGSMQGLAVRPSFLPWLAFQTSLTTASRTTC